MADMIQVRRDTAALWVTTNPILASGELGYESDTGKLKIGDGTTTWTSLAYYTLLIDGITSTAAELNILDGVTSTTAELNILDGVTSTTAELNILDGVTATAAELNYVDGVTSNIQTQLNAAGTVSNVVEDTTPQLGGNLDVQSSEITTSTSNGNIKVTPNGSGVFEVKGAGGGDGTLQLNCSANSHGVKIKSPPHSAAASYTLTLPNNDGDADQVLQTNGSGVLTWASTAAGANIEATATGAITAGTACKFKSDGTVEQFSKTALAVDELKITELSHDSVDNLESGGASAIGYDSKRNQFIHIQWNGTLSEYVMSIGKIENNTVAFSAGQVIGKNWSTAGSTTPGKAIFYDDVNDRIFFFGGEYGKRWAVGVPVGDSYQFKKDGTGFPNHSGSTWYGGSGRTPMFHNGRMFHISREGTWVIFNAYTYISDESTTLTTQELNLTQVAHDHYSMVVDETNSEMLVCMNDGGEDSGYNIFLIDIGGTGTPTEDYDSSLVDSSSDRKDGLQCLCLGSKKYFLSYKNANGKITGQVLTFSGSTPTFHTAVELHSGSSVGPNKSVQLLDGRIFVNWYDDGTIITISGNTVQSGAAEMNAFTNLGMDWGAGGGMAFSSGSDLAVTYFYNGLVGDAIAFSTTTASPDDYVGVAQATVANAAAVTLDVISGTNEALTGLTIGARYYVQRDGTLGTALTGTYAGIAYTATKLLVKG